MGSLFCMRLLVLCTVISTPLTSCSMTREILSTLAYRLGRRYGCLAKRGHLDGQWSQCRPPPFQKMMSMACETDWRLHGGKPFIDASFALFPAVLFMTFCVLFP
ncbi:hypothetical protein EDD22DRAFT_37865 [Suillus occidentalis]|nr:hypothetical protein EDD22DRAFT_37865 [Suillus occidentalis]